MIATRMWRKVQQNAEFKIKPKSKSGMIRAFLQGNRRFQVYTTQDTTALARVFLQVNCSFQVYTTQDTTPLIRAFLLVNHRFQVYTIPKILQYWLEYFCKLTVAFRYTLPRILQEWLEHFCKLTVVHHATDSNRTVRVEWLQCHYTCQIFKCRFAVGQLSVNCCYTAGRQCTDSRPTDF